MLLNPQRIILYQLDYRILIERCLDILVCLMSGSQFPDAVIGAMLIIGVIPACEALAAVVVGG